jgi:hypothetical protein
MQQVSGNKDDRVGPGKCSFLFPSACRWAVGAEVRVGGSVSASVSASEDKCLMPMNVDEPEHYNCNHGDTSRHAARVGASPTHTDVNGRVVPRASEEGVDVQ